ncbi:MAG: IS630 family transposase [Candidatus Saccharimonadales bacterium]
MKLQKITLTTEEKERLLELSRSRTHPLRVIQRAQILLKLAENQKIETIARSVKTSRPTVYKCIKKALAGGVEVALKDYYHRPKPPTITEEAKAWVMHLACTKPKDLGFAAELWTQSALAKYIRKAGSSEGHDCLAKANKATVHRILKSHSLKPHKIRYYLEKRDDMFEEKMSDILVVYKEVNELLDNPEKLEASKIVTVSVDEKPGVQAIKNVAPDLLPNKQHSRISRDYEYKRLGTVSILGALDLQTGRVFAQVHERHRSQEFIYLLKELDEYYPKDVIIRIILDNHSAHISKETLKYLQSKPNRFKYVHTPKHGSWLNIVEGLFSKMARTFLKHIRVESLDELKQRILQGVAEINAEPVVHRWTNFEFTQKM